MHSRKQGDQALGAYKHPLIIVRANRSRDYRPVAHIAFPRLSPSTSDPIALGQMSSHDVLEIPCGLAPVDLDIMRRHRAREL